MKISIDITRLHASALKRGVGFYTFNLFQALKDLNDNDSYFLIKEKEKEAKNVDLVHYPYFDPFFLTLPFFKKASNVITVHDLIPLKFPSKYKIGIKGSLKWQVQKNLLKQVDVVITDSKTSKKDIINITGYPAEKIEVIYLAAGKKFKQFKKAEWVNKLLSKYNLSKDFLLYVGDLNWNKNVPGLLEAFADIVFLPQFKNLNLALVGGAFENENLAELKGLKSLIKKLNLEKKVSLLGFVETDDLVKLYNAAFLYIQPSFYEGFGLPLLEAMSCGCACLSSNKASLPEVGGRAVSYFNPNKEGDLKLKLKSLLGSTKKIKSLAEKSLKRAEKFSWKATAEKTKQAYKNVLFYS
jgi:glycosyltransferase involved in cell wall biosynthesis